MAEKTELPALSRRAWVGPLLFLLLLSALSMFLHLEKSRRGREVGALREQYAALVRARPIAATKARRARFYKIRYYLDYPASASYAAADLLRRLEGVAPPLRLLSVRIDPGLHALRFELSVAVGPGNAGAAQKRFDRFFGALRGLLEVSDLSFGEKTRADGGLHVFTVRGRADVP